MSEYCNPIWKPPKKKKHRAKKNPVPTDQSLCRYHSTAYASTHEVFGGINRQNSIKYNMQVKLCLECHTRAHRDKQFALQLKREYQQIFESIYSREKFVEVFGRNYLDREVA
jgi:hypothetical protein